MKCTICDLENSKYKCPKCEVPYCSIPCFRKHRPDTGYQCKKPKEFKYDFTKLNDPELQEMLTNEHVQTYVKAISTSDNPNDIFDQLQHNQRFIDFETLVLRLLHD